MTRFFLIFLSVLLLVSCSGKVKTIVELTPTFSSLSKSSNINLKIPSEIPVKNWGNGVNFINNTPENIQVKNLNFAEFINIDVPKIVKSLDYKYLNIGNRFFYSEVLDSNVVVFGDNLILLDKNSNLYSFDLNLRKVNWLLNLASVSEYKRFSAGGLIINGNNLYVTLGTREVVSIDLLTGKENWRKVLGDVVKLQVEVDSEKVYALTVGNKLYALNKVDGSVMWHNENISEVLYVGKLFAPLSYKDSLIVPYTSGVIVAIDKAKGGEIWVCDLTEDINFLPNLDPVNIEPQPVIMNNFLYVSALSYLFKIDISNGEIVWKKNIAEIKAIGRFGENLILVNNAREAALVSSADGGLIWSSKLYSDKDVLRKVPVTFSTPVMVNGDIHIADSAGKLHILSATNGSVKNVINIPGGYLSTIIYNDNYYIINNSSILYKKR